MKEKKLSFLEIIWIYTIGCVLGYVIETMFYLIKYHNYVNKQGLIIGPFKPIYGIGAIILSITYYMIKKKSNIKIFILGVLLGSIFEYLASLVLEYIFNSYIWDYSSFSFNINGRVYLPYMILWGILSIIWVKMIYIPFKNFFDKTISKTIVKALSIFLAVFILFDTTITGIVLFRQGHRQQTNKIFRIIDNIYSEEKIIKKFPKFRSIH